MNQTRYCSVGGNGLKLYSNGRLFTAIGCDRTSNLPATRSLERLTAAHLNFTLYLFVTESDKSVTVILCLLLPMHLTGDFWRPHNDRHPQPVY